MSDGSIDLSADARAKAWSTPLEDFHPADPVLFQTDSMWPYFERLRKEDPVHLSKGNEETGPYWSVTKYEDIMAVDTDHKRFSSSWEYGGITSGRRLRTSRCRCSSRWTSRAIPNSARRSSRPSRRTC
jgi:cytochrome P450